MSTFELTEPVRAQRRPLRRLLPGRARPGIVAASSVGEYSKRPLYTIFFLDGRQPETGAFFAYELTPAPDLLVADEH